MRVQVDAPEGGLELRDAAVDGALKPLSLRVAPGEVVGLAGVAGAGHHTVLELICGLKRADSGTVELPGGRPVPHGLRGAIRAGVALVSGDRRRLGLMLDKPIWENIAQVRSVGLPPTAWWCAPAACASGLGSRRAGCGSARARSTTPPARLSGGNQQKVVFAKWLDAEPSVVLLDDPTRGVDVGAKAEMHALIRSTAAAGAPVLICSTDIDELATLCDRVVVLYQGEASAELSGPQLTEHRVLEAMNTGRSTDSKVLSASTTTSRSSGFSRRSRDSSLVERGEQLLAVLDPAGVAALGPGHGGRRRWRRTPATARGAAVALGEPVHHRVAAVGEHDEERADAVARRAPQRLDAVHRRAVADHRHHRAVGQRHAQPAAAGRREAEAAHRRAHEAERRAAGSRACSSGRLDGVSSTTIASGGSRSASAASTWPARRGSAEASGRRASAAARRGLARARDRVASAAADRAAGGRRSPRARPGCGAPRPGRR